MSTGVGGKKSVCVWLSGVSVKSLIYCGTAVTLFLLLCCFPLPPVFQFFSYLFPVFPIVVSRLFCVFWLADCLKRNPGWAAAVSSWAVLPGQLVVVHQNEYCWVPLDVPSLVLVEAKIRPYSSTPLVHSSVLWGEPLDLKWTVPPKVVSWGMCSRNTCFLVLFWVCFALEDPVRTGIKLCVVGSNPVEYERFMIANYLNVITRNLQVHGVTNWVCKLNKFLLTLSISGQN